MKRTKVAEGIWKEPNGTFTATCSYTDPLTGRRHQPSKRGFRRERDAKAWRGKQLALRQQGGTVLEPDRTPLAKYLARWLDDHRNRVTPNVAKRYAHFIDTDIVPVIGSLPLGQVRPDHIAEVMSRMRDRGLAPATIRQCRAVMSKALRQALAWGLVTNNPVAATSAPKVTSVEKTVPDVVGLRALQAAAVGTPWEIPMLLATTLGCRRGEVLGFQWRDLDLDTGRIRVARGLVRQDGQLIFKEPKTPRAIRTLRLPAGALERVRRHRITQAEKMLANGYRQTGDTPICASPVGEPLCPDTFTHAAKRFAGAVGIDAARLHDSRGAVATELITQGVPLEDVSEVLGHADPGFTLRVYRHLRDGAADRAAEAMERALAEGL